MYIVKRWRIMSFKRAIIFIVSLCLVLGSFTVVHGATSSASKLKTPSITLSTVSSTGKTKVSWKKVNNAVSYKVYSSTNKSKWTLLSTTKKLNCTHSKATAGKTYYYKVKAIAKKSKNNSNYSSIKSRTCRYKYPITAKVSLSNSNPKVTWNSVKGASKYKVQRSYSKSSGYSALTTTKNKYYTDKNAKKGVTVYYKVTALNSKGKTISKSLSAVSIKTKAEAPESFEVKYVAKPSAALYTKASSSSSHITIPYMAEVKLGNKAVSSSSKGAWYKVYYKDKTYYAWINKGSNTYTTTKSTFTYTCSNKYQQAAVDLAKEIAMEWKTFYDYDTDRAVGEVIKNGAHGFDCSGFVVHVITSAMKEDVPTYWLTTNIKNLANTTCVYNYGQAGEYKPSKVSLENIQPGDVIFFDQKSKFDHCGIYLGNNEFAHASNFWSNDGVCIMPLVDEYLDDINCIRRYIPKEANVKPVNKTMYIASGCNSYVEMDSNGEKARYFRSGEEVTLLWTFNSDTHSSKKGNYGYIRTEDGQEMFILLKNLIEY